VKPSVVQARPWLVTIAILATALPVTLHGWGGQGHRLVAELAARRLTPIATQNVSWLLDGRPMSDIASWADDYRGDNTQTGLWHYLNIPPDATTYDRDRDCPRQAGVAAGSRDDRWRDCVVDRILYHQQRLADVALDRPDRAIALKFLVHFVGDLHQPFHALGVAQGGNEIRVTVFGSSNCSTNPDVPRPCNLHSVWDSLLIGHRGWNDQQSLNALDNLIARRGWQKTDPGTPAEWAVQSFRLAKAAMVPEQGSIDEKYYRAQIDVIDERLALAGIRLAAVLNKSLTTSPPSR
jgi:hypothetical protein